jgi:hypothetical protein
VAIFGIISGVVAFAVIQTLNVNASSTNREVAIRQVQNAGYWVSRDAQQAQVVLYDAEDPADVDELLILSWTDWGDTSVNPPILTAKNFVVYVKNGDQIIRYHYKGSTDKVNYWDSGVQLLDQMTVARFISGATCTPGSTGPLDPKYKVIKLTVTATVGGFQQASETRVYEIIPRAHL